MIGIGIKLEVKKSKILTDGQKRLALPMVEVTRMLGEIVLSRIQSGRGPQGPWKTYGAGGEARDEQYFWVAPGREQPGDPAAGNGLKFRVKSGPWAGWAAYESVRAYYRLRGLAGRPHTFNDSGKLLQQAAIRIMTPRHIRLAFYGNHGKQSAKNVAWLASRNESDPLLMPSQSEVAEIQQFIVDNVNEQIIEGARLGEQAQRLGQKSASVGRRVSRLLSGGSK